jgi:hypothetical protein
MQQSVTLIHTLLHNTVHKMLLKLLKYYNMCIILMLYVSAI